MYVSIITNIDTWHFESWQFVRSMVIFLTLLSTMTGYIHTLLVYSGRYNMCFPSGGKERQQKSQWTKREAREKRNQKKETHTHTHDEVEKKACKLAMNDVKCKTVPIHMKTNSQFYTRFAHTHSARAPVCECRNQERQCKKARKKFIWAWVYLRIYIYHYHSCHLRTIYSLTQVL